MLQILVFLSRILIKVENGLTVQDSWNDLQFEMEGVFVNYCPTMDLLGSRFAS